MSQNEACLPLTSHSSEKQYSCLFWRLNTKLQRTQMTPQSLSTVHATLGKNWKQQQKTPTCCTWEILTLGVDPPIALPTLHHLALVVVIIVALVTERAEVSWKPRLHNALAHTNGLKKPLDYMCYPSLNPQSSGVTNEYLQSAYTGRSHICGIRIAWAPRAFTEHTTQSLETSLSVMR